MITEILLLTVGFALLIKGADWLVSGSSALARRAGIQELIIGLTIVAFGTSAPELVVNIFSSARGLGDMTLSNVIGSNIFNLMLILGMAGLVYPLIVQNQTTWKEIPFSLLAALLVLLLISDTAFGAGINQISRWDAVILLTGFVLFMLYIWYQLKNHKENLDTDVSQVKASSWKLTLLVIVGLAGLIAGSQLVVNNAVSIAQNLGWSEKVIGITIVSAGTSLPELVTSVVAAFRRKTDIAVGNVIGSNLFNLLLVLGVSGAIRPIRLEAGFQVDLLILAIATALVFIAMFSGKKYKLDRWEAGILLMGYVFYLTWQLQQ